MKKLFVKNCCDGMYNSFDVHFTNKCDNKCGHCIDMRFNGVEYKKTDIHKIYETVYMNSKGIDDILFLGGEPCLDLKSLVRCVEMIKMRTNLKIFVTTAVPKICYDEKPLFYWLLAMVDGMNLSVQHNNESIADIIRRTQSKYPRQEFYASLPYKDKIRINLNIVKPFLHTKKQITECIRHYDAMGFNSIKLSEIQHGKEFYTSFEKVFDINLKSPFYNGCQAYLPIDQLFPGITTPILLKRSCFLCEETLNASFVDGVKVFYQYLFGKAKNKYGVIYGNGQLSQGWL
jgi:organic radical activating enzyme